ncbi:hypothetical protein CCP4SC76_3380002 [Gammaproteobacteria bacterium]
MESNQIQSKSHEINIIYVYIYS